MGDNGPEPEKTAEQLESERIEAKKARFAQDPESFIEISEIVMCAIRNPGAGLGISIMVGGSRQELDISLVELQHAAFGMISMMKMNEAKARQQKIITPGARIKDIFRRR